MKCYKTNKRAWLRCIPVIFCVLCFVLIVVGKSIAISSFEMQYKSQRSPDKLFVLLLSLLVCFFSSIVLGWVFQGILQVIGLAKISLNDTSQSECFDDKLNQIDDD
jgi:membrane-anchored glycerophosphoryl diester phosphodiesterase (GDPDase)